MDSKNFADFNLSDELKAAVTEIGYTEATDIQIQSIPLILEGHDVIGHSQTGSGKTASFGLPAIDLVDTALSPKITQVLILCPTRELALQATDELKKFSKYKKGVKIVPVFGGASIDRQIQLLKQGCQIVVGTPGRIMDHMRRKTLKLDQLRIAILDEADEMLNMGFRDDIETILSDTPEDRQTILFSATMPRPILEITKRFQKDPKMVKIEAKQLTVDTIEQSYFEVARGRKNDALFLLLEYYEPKLSIVFCNTKKMVDELVAELNRKGFAAQGLHGDMKQAQRTQVMNRFKDGAVGILVATDVAARGIDVNDIDIVFNYDLPDDNEYYVHRIGRTGRAGKKGRSFSLIQGTGQLMRLNEIAGYTKSAVKRTPLPLVSEIKDRNVGKLSTGVEKYMERHDCEKYLDAVMALAEHNGGLEKVACALFAMNIKKPTVKVDCGAEISLPVRGGARAGFKPQMARRKGRDSRGVTASAMSKYENEEMAEVRLSIGRNDGVAPNHILGAVAGESGLPGKIMGTINIKNAYTTIDVPKKFKARIVKSLNNATVRGKKITAD